VVLGATAALLLAVPVAANGGAQATRGDIHTFAAGPGNISGHVLMLRSNNRTSVILVVKGLAANTTYGAHVHLQACGVGDAGVHYKFDPSGPVDNVNEIWPGFTTNKHGVGVGIARNEGIAGPTAVSVVIHAPGGAKIACADLS
jgi:hypothetical protein